jgi:hypothetical protein
MGFHRDLVGKDLHAPSSEKVENHTGSTFPKFKAVSFNGLGTALPQIVLGGDPRGVTQRDILTWAPDQGTGYITCFGILNEVDTSLFAVGNILYSDGLGNLSTATNGRPIAQVLKADATFGIVYVLPPGYATTATTKSGRLLNSDFAGSPKKATVTFAVPFPATPYAVNVTGVDSRAWTIESMANGSFVINSGANLALTGDVFWEAQQTGEF